MHTAEVDATNLPFLRDADGTPIPFLSWVEQVTNPKVAEALHDAHADITALLEVIGPRGRGDAVGGPTRLGG